MNEMKNSTRFFKFLLTKLRLSEHSILIRSSFIFDQSSKGDQEVIIITLKI